MAIPARVAQRMTGALKQYQPILNSARARDCNESDTVVIVTDILADLFGYDKYTEITSEYSIRGTYCDLVVKISDVIRIVIEIKAIGTDFRDTHIKQAVDYAANQGVDWVILTNGVKWRIYRVTFAKPIDARQVAEIDLSEISPTQSGCQELLYLLTREGIEKNALDDFVCHHEATSRHLIAAIVVSDEVLKAIRREMRRVNPDVKVDTNEIREKLVQEVLRRETLEGEDADSARRRVCKAGARQLRRRPRKAACTEDDETIAASGDAD